MTRPNPPKSQASDTASDAPPELGTNPRPRSAASSALNLMIAQIILRSATDMFSRKVAKRVRETAPKAGDDDPKRRARSTMATTMSLYAANRLAKRSFGGLMLVTGGLVAKLLYDRGTEREWREYRDRLEHERGDEAADKHAYGIADESADEGVDQSVDQSGAT
ncbi:MAG: hypothetical protein HRT63_05140 [Erythrobacter sp.]|nr:hypothetical protein [Erythrobacter sp.]